MNRSLQRKYERRGGGSAAALQDLDRKRVACGFEQQAQGRRRSALKRLGWAKERHPGAAGFRGHGKAPQLLVARGLEPGEERLTSGAQELLRGPQRIASARGAHQRELGEID